MDRKDHEEAISHWDLRTMCGSSGNELTEHRMVCKLRCRMAGPTKELRVPPATPILT